MKVLKFGGTSVGSAKRMREAARLMTKERCVVVLSAMAGTTNALAAMAERLYAKDVAGARTIIDTLNATYGEQTELLFHTPEYRQKGAEMVARHFEAIRAFTSAPFTLLAERSLLAQGELLSTGLMLLYLHEEGVEAAILPALDYMRLDANREPDPTYIKDKLLALLAANKNATLYLTQGYICRNAEGEIDNLQRGGSDYTASLVGAAVGAEEIQIWTDIDGMHNNDPRFVEGTTPVRRLHFDEAAELAYFGAKILHPTCILPAKINHIPVRLLNTLQPDAPGTLISNETEKGKIKAVAAKDAIVAIKIKSGHMLLATGFLRKVFEIFENYRTPVDMVTTSEVGVSCTIDNRSHLNEIVADLQTLGAVTVDSDMAIICVVGDMEWENVGFEAAIVNALKDIPVRMIAYGGSDYNVSLLVKATDKRRALQALSAYLFN